MSRTVLAKRHHRPPTIPEIAAPAIDRWGLLEAAGAGDASAVGRLCDLHGGALFGPARAILSDPDRRTYLYATRCLDNTSRPGSGSAMMTGLTELARRQRSAVVLAQYGDHTVGGGLRRVGRSG